MEYLLKSAMENCEVLNDEGMKCLVSMEQRMACGAGICLCCTVKVKDDGPDGYKNVRCCKEGPVFDSKEVAWA